MFLASKNGMGVVELKGDQVWGGRLYIWSCTCYVCSFFYYFIYLLIYFRSLNTNFHVTIDQENRKLSRVVWVNVLLIGIVLLPSQSTFYCLDKGGTCNCFLLASGINVKCEGRGSWKDLEEERAGLPRADILSQQVPELDTPCNVILQHRWTGCPPGASPGRLSGRFSMGFHEGTSLSLFP